MTRKLLCIVLLALPLALAACDDDGEGGLGEDDVTDLPPGDGSGTWASGSYQAELYVADCSGDCSVEAYGYTVSLCDVGATESIFIEVTQEDGALTVDLTGGDFIVTRLEGGIDQDGAFDVGGYGTENGGDVESATRGTGTISEGGEISGEARAHTWGTYDDSSVDCTATYEVDGERITSD